LKNHENEKDINKRKKYTKEHAKNQKIKKD